MLEKEKLQLYRWWKLSYERFSCDYCFCLPIAFVLKNHFNAAKCQDGEVKLLGDNIMQGLVLVCSNKRWGTLCNSQTDENTGTVCRQLGYDGGKPYSHHAIDRTEFFFVIAGYIRYYQQDTVPRVPVRVTGLSCHGDETRVFDCSYSKSNESQLCSDPLNIWCFSGN